MKKDPVLGMPYLSSGEAESLEVKGVRVLRDVKTILFPPDHSS